MSILDIKDVEAYDQDVVKFLRFYEFPAGRCVIAAGGNRCRGTLSSLAA